MSEHEYYVDADKINVMRTKKGSRYIGDQEIVALCATGDAGGMKVALRIAEMLNGSVGHAPSRIIPGNPWQTVPLPPTAEMIAAGEALDKAMRDQGFANADPDAVYMAMLDAAPMPPLVDRSELIALLEDLASVNLSREAVERQARRMADDLIARGLRLSPSTATSDEPVADDSDHMVKISKLIGDLQSIKNRFGDTCVYIRRGGLSWGAVALNRRDDDKKRGVFELQAQHDHDMLQRLEQIERLKKSRDQAEMEANRLRAALADPRNEREGGAR